MNASRKLILPLLAVLALVVWAAPPVRAADEHASGTAVAKPESAAPHNEGGKAAPHGHEAEEEPELLQGTAKGLIPAITSLIIFALLVAILGKYAWGPIAKGLQDREDKIRKDIEEAEAARARAEATQREYAAQLATAEQKVRDLLAKAGQDAEQIAAGVRTRAQQEAQETKENATRDIDIAKRDALREVHEHAAVLSTRVAEKILRRNLNPDDQRDLVAASLDQLQSVKG
jgi:F-type H+-transporting ATPase subunit b